MRELSVAEQRYQAVMAVIGDGLPGVRRRGRAHRSALTAAGDSDVMGSAPAAWRQVNRKGVSAISRTVPSMQAAKRLA
jgi:hypothetical protein